MKFLALSLLGAAFLQWAGSALGLSAAVSLDPAQPNSNSFITVTVQGVDYGGPLTVTPYLPINNSGDINLSAHIAYGSNSLGLSPYTITYTIPPLPVGSYVLHYYYIHDSNKSYIVGATVPFTVVYVPKAGLWWNPDESGTGYAFDVKHGVLVATIYSFTPDGSPTWYLASGPIDSNNTVTAALSKYENGQCISCSYAIPGPDGSDGTVTIQFTSSVTGTITLPGRPPTWIIRQAF